MPAQRGELADRDSIPRHDERLTMVQLAHDVAAVIAELPLSDLFGHTKVWHGCYEERLLHAIPVVETSARSALIPPIARDGVANAGSMVLITVSARCGGRVWLP